jgi:integrative and conjugative element protein (TIGR02256 family)
MAGEDGVNFGEPISDALPDSLRLPVTQQVWAAVEQRREFTFLEARRLERDGEYAEVLVVDCENDAVPSRNPVGIQYRERLALVLHNSPDRIPEVRALRGGFPVTAHQNHVAPGEPPSLCLYFAFWAEVRRTWTAQRHLNRIKWWLTETAKGTLHRPDQPLEQLYFESQFELVLPFDFGAKVTDKNYKLVVANRGQSAKTIRLVGGMRGRNEPVGGQFDLPCIALSLPPIVHGTVEPLPWSLGELEDQLGRRGASLTALLFDSAHSFTANGVFQNSASQITLLVLSVPLLRAPGGVPEVTVETGFVIETNIGDLGVATGALHKLDGTYLAVNLIGAENPARQGWRDFGVTPLTVLPAFTPEMARLTSGIEDDGPAGLIAGVGALGCKLVDLWTRSGWGRWTLIDPDHVKPHNLARQNAVEGHIGINKADVTAGLANVVFAGQPVRVSGITADATNLEDPRIGEAIDRADLIVDVTTTFGFPRTIAARDTVTRAMSTFLTPSGLAAVMLVEDSARTIRLDALEAQYYRQVISEPWGAAHLAENRGHLWSGAGCRDLSTVIPNELIALHGANLARMVRLQAARPEASLRTWHYDAGSGALKPNAYASAMSLSSSVLGLKIVSDVAVRLKVRQQRERHLPNETGGILLGYFDLVLGSVFIVDALSAPSDSSEERTGFVRGIAGLEEAVAEAARRTAYVVRYVGEWHSHPRGHSSRPSADDVLLLEHLAAALDDEGLPALMLIVGESEESWFAGKTA